ncbi:hypothetical protein B0T18DRAFT_409590 [Schizothecium vesticola]|uniref:Uncharacterized protein n=1 Tax=Schizothecium vesticola TaxID=314040 RepID=A0AA40EU55_9PEZI|nr:hypothetical protein B0T18DRAFT_409590 [Schizothecium vesticola]
MNRHPPPISPPCPVLVPALDTKIEQRERPDTTTTCPKTGKARGSTACQLTRCHERQVPKAKWGS